MMVTAFCCEAYREATCDGDVPTIFFLNRFTFDAGGYRQESTLPPVKYCPWCGSWKSRVDGTKKPGGRDEKARGEFDGTIAGPACAA